MIRSDVKLTPGALSPIDFDSRRSVFRQFALGERAGSPCPVYWLQGGPIRAVLTPLGSASRGTKSHGVISRIC